jgi:hypothetical protein
MTAMTAMRTIGLVLLVCLASCAKKPAAKNPTPPPTAEPAAPESKEAPKPDVTNTPRTGDPCDGGQKPK